MADLDAENTVYVVHTSWPTRGTLASPSTRPTYVPLAGHEVSRIVSCVVAKHADETAYLGNLAHKTTKIPKHEITKLPTTT